MLAVCRQQALALVSLSQNSKDKLWSQSVNSGLVHSLMTSQSPSIYSHAHTRARTHASAPKHHHRSPGVSWSKCVLASRTQQGQVKKKKEKKGETTATAVLSLYHIPATLLDSTSQFFILSLSTLGCGNYPAVAGAAIQSNSTDELPLERRTPLKSPLSLRCYDMLAVPLILLWSKCLLA